MQLCNTRKSAAMKTTHEGLMSTNECQVTCGRCRGRRRRWAASRQHHESWSRQIARCKQNVGVSRTDNPLNVSSARHTPGAAGNGAASGMFASSSAASTSAAARTRHHSFMIESVRASAQPELRRTHRQSHAEARVGSTWTQHGAHWPLLTPPKMSEGAFKRQQVHLAEEQAVWAWRPKREQQQRRQQEAGHVRAQSNRFPRRPHPAAMPQAMTRALGKQHTGTHL